eukprot:TRINITY_DN14597_c0_g1_i1.p1 TRINITY_DN14597_c0_g1~~TRINITY_DN14597_c0_g1_i1.p1  ORF type:complete len:349 (-),score=64.05 TRINITY_DN14597_c0_g1_i1:57-1103(-)
MDAPRELGSSEAGRWKRTIDELGPPLTNELGRMAFTSNSSDLLSLGMRSAPLLYQQASQGQQHLQQQQLQQQHQHQQQQQLLNMVQMSLMMNNPEMMAAMMQYNSLMPARSLHFPSMAASAFPSAMLPPATIFQGTPSFQPRLVILTGPGHQVFKDAAIRFRIKIENAAEQRLSLPARIQLAVSIEDMHGHTIGTIVKGKRAGEPILSSEQFQVNVNTNFEMDVPNVRIREVSANHGAAAFCLVVRMPSYPHILPAKTSLFYVRSERMRSPSYHAQQGTRGRKAAKVDDASVPLAPISAPSTELTAVNQTPVAVAATQEPGEVQKKPADLMQSTLSYVADAAARALRP